MGVEAAVGETPGLTGEFIGETHRGLERAQAHPPGNQHQKGPLCLWVAGEMTESLLKDQQQHCSLLDPAPKDRAIRLQDGLPRPAEYLRLHPLLCNRHSKTKKYGSNVDLSSRKRRKQQGDSQPIRCGVQNTGNQDAHGSD